MRTIILREKAIIRSIHKYDTDTDVRTFEGVFKITIINMLKAVMEIWTTCKIGWTILSERGEL